MHQKWTFGSPKVRNFSGEGAQLPPQTFGSPKGIWKKKTFGSPA